MKSNLFISVLIIIHLIILNGCSEKESKSSLNLLCEINKAHLIKSSIDGGIIDQWLDKDFINQTANQSEEFKKEVQPILIEIDMESEIWWLNGRKAMGVYKDNNGVGWIKEKKSEIAGYIQLAYISVDFNSKKYLIQVSEPIKNNENKYERGFDSMLEIYGEMHGECKEI